MKSVQLLPSRGLAIFHSEKFLDLPKYHLIWFPSAHPLLGWKKNLLHPSFQVMILQVYIHKTLVFTQQNAILHVQKLSRHLSSPGCKWKARWEDRLSAMKELCLKTEQNCVPSKTSLGWPVVREENDSVKVHAVSRQGWLPQPQKCAK